MRAKISESRLNRIIAESIEKVFQLYSPEEGTGITKKKELRKAKELHETRLLNNKIRRMVRESFEDMGDMYQYEDDMFEKKKKKDNSDKDGRLSDEHTENSEQRSVRREVMAYFLDGDEKKDGIDLAPFAYELYDVEPIEGEDTDEMKNARSKFAKCLYGEPNDDGIPYSFSSEQINTLKSIISDR